MDISDIQDLDASNEFKPGEPKFYEYLGICVALVTAAGVFSGLTLGYVIYQSQC